MPPQRGLQPASKFVCQCAPHMSAGSMTCATTCCRCQTPHSVSSSILSEGIGTPEIVAPTDEAENPGPPPPAAPLPPAATAFLFAATAAAAAELVAALLGSAGLGLDAADEPLLPLAAPPQFVTIELEALFPVVPVSSLPAWNFRDREPQL